MKRHRLLIHECSTRPTEENLLTQLEEEFVSDTEDDGVNIEPEDIVRWIHIPHTNVSKNQYLFLDLQKRKKYGAFVTEKILPPQD